MKPEQVTFEWRKQIQREMPFGAEWIEDHKGNGIGEWQWKNQSPISY